MSALREECQDGNNEAALPDGGLPTFRRCASADQRYPILKLAPWVSYAGRPFIQVGPVGPFWCIITWGGNPSSGDSIGKEIVDHRLL